MADNNNDCKIVLLEDMPIDVFQLIDNHLCVEDVINLCLASKTIYERHVSGNLIKIRAENVIKYETPWARNVSSVTEQARLISQGFSTIYHVKMANNPLLFGPEKDVIRSSYFGMRKESINFSILGFPAKRGTVIHILFEISDGEDGIPTLIADVYFSLEEMYQQLSKSYDERQRVMDSFMDDIFDREYEICLEHNRKWEPKLENLLGAYSKGLDMLLNTGGYGYADRYRYFMVRLP